MSIVIAENNCFLLCLGRRCDNPSCKGILRDTIVNFGENLPDSKNKKTKREGEREKEKKRGKIKFIFKQVS